MIWLTISSGLILLSYILASVIKGKGTPISLSDTYYLWPKWVFPTVMTFTAFTLLPCWLELTKDSYWQFASFLACAGFIFVGTAPDFRNDKGEYNIHVVCAYLAATASIISVTLAIDEWWRIPYNIAISFLCFLWEIKTKYLFILEWGILLAVYSAVIINLA